MHIHTFVRRVLGASAIMVLIVMTAFAVQARNLDETQQGKASPPSAVLRSMPLRSMPLRSTTLRADVVTSANEMPGVLFNHDAHVQAAERDCAVCHMPFPAVSERVTLTKKNDSLTYDSAHLNGNNASFNGMRPSVNDKRPFLFAFTGGSETGLSKQDAYHKTCVGCHEQPPKPQKTSGPALEQCRLCHMAPETDPVLFLPAFDKSLHSRHINSPAINAPAVTSPAVRPPDKTANPSISANCAACHHPVQTAAQAIAQTATPAIAQTATPAIAQTATPATAQTPEQTQAQSVANLTPNTALMSCRVCHTTTTVEERPALRTVAHETCVVCHEANAKARSATGPVDCSGCHIADTWARYSKMSPVPLLPAGQPVSVLMTPTPRTTLNVQGNQTSQAAPAIIPSMPLVSFNHSLHEKALPSCRLCHHKAIQACGTCHTMSGNVEKRNAEDKNVAHEKAMGSNATPSNATPSNATPSNVTPNNTTLSNVTLPQAMHSKKAPNSCIGCHEQRKAQENCAGCHVEKPAASAATQCAFCHTPLAAQTTGSTGSSEELTDKEPMTTPKALPFAQAFEGMRTTPEQFMPETVTIDLLTDQYQACEFPHGDIVRALQRGITATAPSLTAFHDKDYQLCQGCHHNTPANEMQYKCSACHLPSLPNQSKDMLAQGNIGSRPELKIAYHQQCMGCHDRMQILKPASTDCIACHAEAKK